MHCCASSLNPGRMSSSNISAFCLITLAMTICATHCSSSVSFIKWALASGPIGAVAEEGWLCRFWPEASSSNRSKRGREVVSFRFMTMVCMAAFGKNEDARGNGAVPLGQCPTRTGQGNKPFRAADAHLGGLGLYARHCNISFKFLSFHKTYCRICALLQIIYMRAYRLACQLTDQKNASGPQMNTLQVVLNSLLFCNGFLDVVVRQLSSRACVVPHIFY